MITPTTPSTLPPPLAETRLRQAAQDLEATFIAEMLRAAGAETGTGLDGGAQSEFASFLLEARAQEIARAGGLGLAETLFESLARRDDAA